MYPYKRHSRSLRSPNADALDSCLFWRSLSAAMSVTYVDRLGSPVQASSLDVVQFCQSLKIDIISSVPFVPMTFDTMVRSDGNAL